MEKKSRIRKQINDNTYPSSNNKDKDIHWRIQKKGSNIYIYYIYTLVYPTFRPPPSSRHLHTSGRKERALKENSHDKLHKGKKRSGSLQFTRASGWKHEKSSVKLVGCYIEVYKKVKHKRESKKKQTFFATSADKYKCIDI